MLPYTVLLLLHLLAATFWVGGMATLHFCVRPAAVEVLAPPQRLPLMAAALRRFLLGVAGAVVLLWLSGLAMVGLAGGMATVPPGVHLMLGLALVMTLIYAWVWRLHAGTMQPAVARQDWPAAGAALARIRMLVALNLGLGTVIFVVVRLARGLAG